jgi:negative regulator of sigma-B (phosphoserine phosphatase)
MKREKIHVSIYQKGKSGNNHCGDRYFFTEADREFICIIVDGLGSGIMAGESAQVVIDIIKTNPAISNKAFVKKCTEELSGKRGVVLGVLRIDFISQKYTYSSIGNVGLVVIINDDQIRRTIPRLGFLGSYERNLRVEQGKLQANHGFLIFSDGVTDRELSKICICNKNVDEVIEAFSHISNDVRKDDTTLIAIRYTDNHFRADS